MALSPQLSKWASKMKWKGRVLHREVPPSGSELTPCRKWTRQTSVIHASKSIRLGSPCFPESLQKNAEQNELGREGCLSILCLLFQSCCCKDGEKECDRHWNRSHTSYKSPIPGWKQMVPEKAKLISLACWDTKRIFLVKTGHEMAVDKTISRRVQGLSLKPWVGV